MSLKSRQLDEYRQFLLSRTSVTQSFTAFVDNLLVSENEAAKHSFHKFMVHNWSDSPKELFEELQGYLGASFVPVLYTCQGPICSFYTSSLNLVMKAIKFDFMFPFQRNMYNLDILFNAKNSVDLFRYCYTLDEVVAGVVSNRFDENCCLNLSNFCHDDEFEEKHIFFYDLKLLASFKILMLRMGRDTKYLNLSNNNLSQMPTEILNFFIRGPLIGVDLSHNNITSIADVRLLSRIETLCLDGNPLCEEEDMNSYLKQIMVKFPRLKELDGIKVNQYGIMYPFWKNFMPNTDKRTKMLVEKFLTLYFAIFDSEERQRIINFYHELATLTMTSELPDSQSNLNHIVNNSRNILDPVKKLFVQNDQKIYKRKEVIMNYLLHTPKSIHDPTTFTVDVMKHDKTMLLIIVEGVFKDKLPPKGTPAQLYHFRRTFLIENRPASAIMTEYCIRYEMFHITMATQEMIDSSFKHPIRMHSSFALLEPSQDHMDNFTTLLCHVTNLKRQEAALRLQVHHWDFRKALQAFREEMKNNSISPDKFVESELSDLSSIDDDLD